MLAAKYRRGWYVTNITNGIKGKIVDVFATPRGIEYTIQVQGAGPTGSRLTFGESQLIREGGKFNNFKQSKKGGY